MAEAEFEPSRLRMARVSMPRVQGFLSGGGVDIAFPHLNDKVTGGSCLILAKIC